MLILIMLVIQRLSQLNFFEEGCTPEDAISCITLLPSKLTNIIEFPVLFIIYLFSSVMRREPREIAYWLLTEIYNLFFNTIIISVRTYLS